MFPLELCNFSNLFFFYPEHKSIVVHASSDDGVNPFNCKLLPRNYTGNMHFLFQKKKTKKNANHFTITRLYPIEQKERSKTTKPVIL